MRINFDTVSPKQWIISIQPEEGKSLEPRIQGDTLENVGLNVLHMSGAPFSPFNLTLLEEPSVFNRDLLKTDG